MTEQDDLPAEPEASGRPADAHRLLGWHLRHLREACDVSADAAGRRIDCSASKISRIECGRCRVKEDDLHRLLDLYGNIDQRRRHALAEFAGRLNGWQWWDGYGEVVSGWLRSYLVLESIAQLIRTYEARFIPGLLQTPAYAEAVIRLHHSNENEIRRRVEVRMHRQRLLLERGTPRLWAPIDQSALTEAALPGGITTPAVVRKQIEFLLSAANRPNIIIQILPAGVGARAGIATSFSLLRFKNLTDVAYLELIGDALFLNQRDKVDHYAIAMNRLTIGAGQPQDAVATLEKALNELPAD